MSFIGNLLLGINTYLDNLLNEEKENQIENSKDFISIDNLLINVYNCIENFTNNSKNMISQNENDPNFKHIV
jgi:hypothetical protein